MITTRHYFQSIRRQERSGSLKGIMILALLFVSLNQLSAAANLNYTLKPPTNCDAEAVECTAFLIWSIPDSLGNIPPGLLGYKIYKNSSLLITLPDPNDSLFYDFTDPGIFLYSVTAYYDLAPYGFPGQFGESSACVMDSLDFLYCYYPLPFSENWNSGNFYFLGWQFQPSFGNWIIDVNSGNPTPSASFEGSPGLTNYSFRVNSVSLLGIPYHCADFSYSFDYKLEDVNPSGTEHLEIGVIMNDAVYPLDTLSNTGSTGWVHEVFDIDQVAGYGFKVYFRAFGENSSRITRWLIDNIIVDKECKPVTDLDYSVSGNLVDLSWNHPCDTARSKGYAPSGYFVYRTDESGQPPFTLLNPEPVTVRFFIDTVPSVAQNAKYRYIVTAYFDDEQPGWGNCESPGDTVLIVPASRTVGRNAGSIKILPNPGSGVFLIQLPDNAKAVEVFNITGTRLFQMSIVERSKETSLDLTGYPDGVYFLQIKSNSGTIVRKIIKI
jgi:hypothetical protein